jgi:hypothetical protein
MIAQYGIEVQAVWNEAEQRWMATARPAIQVGENIVEHRYHVDRNKAEAKALAAMLERFAKIERMAVGVEW